MAKSAGSCNPISIVVKMVDIFRDIYLLEGSGFTFVLYLPYFVFVKKKFHIHFDHEFHEMT